MTRAKPADSPFSNALRRALRYLSRAPKTVKQMQQYLAQKAVDPDTAEEVITRLLEERYLDDTQFAAWYIESRVRTKPRSVFALGYELHQKGVPQQISESLLQGYQDEELALKAVEKMIKRWQGLPAETFQKKLTNYLRYRGFSYRICRFVEDRLNIKENRT